MQNLDPIVVIFAGAPCTGKTTAAKGLCRLIGNSFLVEKDDIVDSLLYMGAANEGNFPGLVSSEEYLVGCYGPNVLGGSVSGLMSDSIFKLPRANPFYLRHVREQSYRAMISISRENLKLGKVMIFSSVVSGYFSNSYAGFIQKLLDSFVGYKTALIYMHLPEEVLHQRMVEAIGSDPTRKKRDLGKISDDESWQIELKKNPVFPKNLGDFNHLKVDALQSPEKCVSDILTYINSLVSK